MVNHKPALTVSKGRTYAPIPRIVRVTPTMAEKFLNTNTLNRPLVSAVVEKYARDMRAGNWTLNGETIIISATGRMLDGQHRMWAVIESQMTVEFLIVEGVDDDTMSTIDTGKARSYSDVRHLRGGKYNSLISSAARWLYWYTRDPRPASEKTSRPTHSELDTFLVAYPEAEDRANEVMNMRRARKRVTPSVLMFVYTLAYRADPGRAGSWLKLIDEGTDMDAKHPVHQLRERMADNATAKAKLQSLDVAALTIKSWNQYITGKRTKTLRWSSAESFPEIATTTGR